MKILGYTVTTWHILAVMLVVLALWGIGQGISYLRKKNGEQSRREQEEKKKTRVHKKK